MKRYFTVIVSILLVSTSFAQVNHTSAGIASDNHEQKPAITSADINVPNDNLSPNPLSECLTIAWNYFNITLNLSIFDSAGNIVFQRRISNNSKVSLKHLSDGVYYYKLTDGPFFRKSGKLMIRH